MNKPQGIIELEKKLHLELFESSRIAKSGFITLNNSYHLDNKQNVIALNISHKRLENLDALCQFPNLISLDVSHNNISDISQIKLLKDLEFLNITENIISNISDLTSLFKLKKIYINNNQVNNLLPLSTLNQIEHLELYNNDIESIVAISDLKCLKILNLGCNRLVDLCTIENFLNLEVLDISDNNLENISTLSNLKKLIVLNLSNNILSDISVVSNFQKLRRLNLENNNIADFTPLRNLLDVNNLNLSGTNLSDISFLRDLHKLITLDISYNKIISLDPLKDLQHLAILYAGANLITDISPILKIETLVKVALHNNKKVEIDFPPEILNSDWKNVKEYAKESGKNVIFKNVKILLLGNSNIGKSTLVQYLETDKFSNARISTHGVEYKKILKNDITYHIWDFGGQEYFHATYKLFFSANALNIILWGKDTGDDSENISTFSLKYWLRTIEQLIKVNRREEVIVAENKIDLNNPKYSVTPINQAKFAADFDTLNLSYVAVSIQDSNGLESLKEYIKFLSQKIVNNFSYPVFYNVFWKRIEELDKDFVTIDEINNRPHKDNVIAALEVFHKMGMLLYFPSIIPDKVFVRPQILLNLIYNTVLSDINKEKISFHEISILTNNNSLQISVDEIIKLMKYFKLVFEIDVEKNVFFIPQYLKPQSPWISELQEASFKYKSIVVEADNFLMGNAMLEIFSQYGNYVIGKESKEYRFWNNGIFIKKDEKILLIKFLRDSQLIEIYEDIKGENFSLQKEVVDFILDLPETIYTEKRHIKNHAKRRFIEVLDMEHEDYSPHLMERLEDEGAYHEFINKGYNTKVNWSSKYFSVFVSIDGKHFVNWEQLNKDKDLLQIKAHSDDESCTVLEIAELSKFIDIKRNKMEKDKEENNQMGNVQFNGPVNIASFGNGNTVHIDNQNSNTSSSNTKHPKSDESLTKKDSKTTLNDIEKKAVKKWKGIALLIFIISLFFTTIILFAYYNEWISIMTTEEWKELKKKEWLKIIATVILVIWNGFTMKIVYDRFFDPSKENSFIDLYRKK